MRGRSAFSLHNWNMLSQSSSFCFFFPLGGTDLTAEVRNKGEITSPHLLLQMESLRTSHWASVSYLWGIIFCTRTLLRGREWRTKRQNNWTQRCQDSPRAWGITADNKAMLFFLLVSTNAKINSVIQIIID